MLTYPLGKDITAFTTDRTIGRDPSLLLPLLEKEGRVLHFARPHQTHQDKVLKVSNEFFCLSIEEQKQMMEGIDAVISNTKDICLGVSTADCIPVIVYDLEHHAAAAIHAGWRGTVKRIVEKTVRCMQESYGTEPEKCMAAIGPGISQQSFEVGWEVHQQFIDAGFDMNDVTIVMSSKDGNGTKPHLDLKEINRKQLLAAGLSAENIIVSEIDTFTDSRFFSARREQKGDEKCGRIFTGFVLR